MAKRLLLPRSQAVGLDGRPLVGAKLLTYITGTSTPKPVFTDAALTVAHANPVIADAAGRFPAMFLGAGDYRTVLTDANDVVIATDDPVEGDAAAAATDIATAALATSRNRFVNPAMQVSQQHGSSNVDCTTGATYTLDQWVGLLSSTPGGTLRIAQTASPTPSGSPFRLRATVQVTDGTLASGDFYLIEQRIEGVMFADARFGSSAAFPLMLRLGLRSSVAGTFGVALRNGAANRSFVAVITIAAGEINTDISRVLTIPGDVAGVWPTDDTTALSFAVCLGCGATFQGTANAWQAGNVITTAAQTNLMATASATFDLFDVGLYVDSTRLNTFPPFQVPNLSDELRRCQRYWERGEGRIKFDGALGGAATMGAWHSFQATKRANPAMSFALTGLTNVTTPAMSEARTNGFLLTCLPNNGAVVENRTLQAIWNADARL